MLEQKLVLQLDNVERSRFAIFFQAENMMAFYLAAILEDEAVLKTTDSDGSLELKQKQQITIDKSNILVANLEII